MAEASSASSLASMIDKNYLECSICTGPFDDPRALPCLHPFCCKCLESWAKACSKDGKRVSCPLCNKVFQVPEEEGIKGFPAHFLVADLQSTVDKAKQKSDGDVCVNHGKKTEYFCENCDCSACSDCAAIDPSHRGHSFIRLGEASQRQISSLEPLITRARNVEERYVRSIQQAEKVEQDLDRAVDVKLKAIDDARNELVQQVDKLIGTLKQDVHKKKEEKMDEIQQTKEKLQVDVAIIRHSCELETNVVESGSHSDVISLYPSLSSSLQQVAQSQPSTVDSNLSQLHLDPPQQTHVYLPSLELLLCDKLNITLPSRENTKASNQTSRHVSAKTTDAKLLSPATLPSSSTTVEKLSSTANSETRSESSSDLTAKSAVGNMPPLTVPPLSLAALKRGSKPAIGRPMSSQSSSPAATGPSASTSTYQRKPIPGSQVAMKSAAVESGGSSFSLFSRPVRQPRKEWKECGQIKTAPRVRRPRGIAIHPNGDFAVTSNWAPVTAFSRNGDFKHVIKGSPSGISDIAITPSNQYIIPGKYGSNEFYINDSQCVLLRTIPTHDINNKPATPSSVAVDSTGRIIVGLGYYTYPYEDKTVSIHQPNGTLISKFETKSPPHRLTCSPDNTLVISFNDNTLQVMDQSGHNTSIIQPPPGTQLWRPPNLCCSKQRELFVSNTYGDPKAVYRYVSTDGEYKYLDCIARGWKPWGIALSANEKKLFVVDFQNAAIKIFQ